MHTPSTQGILSCSQLHEGFKEVKVILHRMQQAWKRYSSLLSLKNKVSLPSSNNGHARLPPFIPPSLVCLFPFKRRKNSPHSLKENNNLALSDTQESGHFECLWQKTHFKLVYARNGLSWVLRLKNRGLDLIWGMGAIRELCHVSPSAFLTVSWLCSPRHRLPLRGLSLLAVSWSH